MVQSIDISWQGKYQPKLENLEHFKLFVKALPLQKDSNVEYLKRNMDKVFALRSNFELFEVTNTLSCKVVMK